MLSTKPRLFILPLLFTIIFLVVSLLSLSATTIVAAPKPTKTPIFQPPTNTPAPTPTPTPSSCYKPKAVTTQLGGYIEGYSGNKSGPYVQGKEIVYNLATFQRIEFSFKTQMSSTQKNLGSYVGDVEGFVVNPNAPTDYTTFRSQYETQMAYNTVSATAPIWSGWSALSGRLGAEHYTTDPALNPQPIFISGDHNFLQSSQPFITGLSGRTGYFWVLGSAKTYIVNCLVDITTLVNDIKTGNSSPTFSGSTVVSPWRDAAAQAAQDAANDYNTRVLTQNG